MSRYSNSQIGSLSDILNYTKRNQILMVLIVFCLTKYGFCYSFYKCVYSYKAQCDHRKQLQPETKYKTPN